MSFSYTAYCYILSLDPFCQSVFFWLENWNHSHWKLLVKGTDFCLSLHCFPIVNLFPFTQLLSLPAVFTLLDLLTLLALSSLSMVCLRLFRSAGLMVSLLIFSMYIHAPRARMVCLFFMMTLTDTVIKLILNMNFKTFPIFQFP